jgi:hypothetical protein
MSSGKSLGQLFLEEHPKTVYRRVREGVIRASRPSPRKTKIHKQDLVAYLMRSGS